MSSTAKVLNLGKRTNEGIPLSPHIPGRARRFFWLTTDYKICKLSPPSLIDLNVVRLPARLFSPLPRLHPEDKMGDELKTLSLDEGKRHIIGPSYSP